MRLRILTAFILVLTLCSLPVTQMYTSSKKITHSKVKKSKKTTRAKTKRTKSISIFKAIEQGNLKAVKRILDRDPKSVNRRDYFKYTPLHFASVKGKVNIMKLLLERGANIKARDNIWEQTPLLSAAFEPDVKQSVINLLLDHHSAINAKDNNGCSSLHHAASHGNLSVVRLLINRGANVNARNYSKETPLISASTYNADTTTISLLLDHHADVNAKAEDGTTPLHGAAFQQNLENVQELINQGADVNAKNDDGDTPLHRAANCDSGNEKVVAFLLDNKADINGKNKLSETALSIAENNGNEELIQLLQSRGATPTEDGDKYACPGKDDTESLFNAISTTRIKDVKLALKNGADVNAVDSEGLTPLHYAATCNDTRIIKLLVDQGAKASTKDHNGYTPLLHAVSTVGVRDEVIKTLLDAGAKTNERDPSGLTPLHWTVRNGDPDMVRLVISRGARVNAKDYSGCTPLHYEMDWGYLNDGTMTKLLLTKGARINAKDNNGNTPLHRIVSQDSPSKEVVQLLLSKGALKGIKNKKNQTALSIAKKKGYTEIVQLLSAETKKKSRKK